MINSNKQPNIIMAKEITGNKYNAYMLIPMHRKQPYWALKLKYDNIMNTIEFLIQK